MTNNQPLPLLEVQPPSGVQKVIPIMLDRPRELYLDANALALLEEETGLNVMRGEFRPNSAKMIRLFFWACLVQDDPSLTLEDVGRHMYVHQFPEAMEIILRLLTNHDPDPNVLAPFVPTDVEVVRAALRLANLQALETLVDLGCGDGRVLIEAGKLGALAVGVENNEERVRMARSYLEVMKLQDRARVEQGMIQDFTFPDTTKVVFVYLLTKSNNKLRTKLLALPDHVRVVSHDFEFSGWTPYAQERITVEGSDLIHTVYAYRIGDQRKKEEDTTDAAAAQ